MPAFNEIVVGIFDVIFSILITLLDLDIIIFIELSHSTKKEEAYPR